MEDDVQAEPTNKINSHRALQEPSEPVNKKDRKQRRSPESLETENKKMRHASSSEEPASQSNGEAGKKEAPERSSSRRNRSPEPRRRNRSRSRSPHRRSSRSPRSDSPEKEHKRGDPRANAARNRQICYDYSRGRCNKGSSCKFVHDDPDESWSREQDNTYHESSSQGQGQKQRTAESLTRDRPSRDPRSSKDSKDPRERGRKKEENNRLEADQIIEKNQLQVAQPPPPGAWSDMQSINQWQQGFTSNTIAAQLQALQKQNFVVPLANQPPPPPPPLGGPPSGFGNLESLVAAATTTPAPDPRVDPRVTAHAPGDPRVSLAQANTDEVQNKKLSDDAGPGESEEKQNGEADAEEVEVENPRKGKKDVKAAMLVRHAVTEYVKEALKPTWKEGKMSKDVYKTIAKKAVDKVVGTLQSHQIPRTAEKVDHFMDFSRQKISKLVQGYVEKYSSNK